MTGLFCGGRNSSGRGKAWFLHGTSADPHFEGLPGFARSLKFDQMRDRLSELVRQRALVSEHLAWLDCEIESVNATPAPAAAPPVTAPKPRADDSTVASALPLPATVKEAEKILAGASMVAAKPSEVPAPLADEVLDQYRVSPKTVHQDVRKGCFLYFAAAFVVLGVVVALLYFAISSR